MIRSEPLSRTALAERRGGIWDYVSPSRLSLWLKCPTAFKLRYIDGIRTPPTQNLFLGKRVHDGLEFFYRHRQAGVRLSDAEISGHIGRHWSAATEQEQVEFKTPDDSDKLLDKCQNLVSCYLENFGGSGETVVGVESAMDATLVDPLTGDRLGLPMVGIVDLLIETNDGPLLVDFKTAARGGHPIEQQHEIQLACYAALFRELSGSVEAGLEIRSLVKTRQPRVQTHRYQRRTDQHFARLFAVIREYLEALRQGVFNFRPGFNCTFCDLREPCTNWVPGAGLQRSH